jgi:uncharacterized protein DUF1918
VISHTGYRWSFELRDARELLLASGVGAEPPSHEYGAPARLVGSSGGSGRSVISRSGRPVRRSGMEFKSGDRVQVESESTERPPRMGVVEEVVQGTADPRYRIRWDDGHESIYTPAAGALQAAEPTEKT